MGLGVSYVRRGLTQPARQQFQLAIAKEPNNLAALLNAASLELESRQFADAEDLYRRATKLAPSEPIALLGLATAAFANGDTDLARRTAQTLAGMDDVHVHFSLGLLFAKNSLYAEAEREFEAVVSKGPPSADLFLNLGLVCSAQQKYDVAKRSYFQAIDLNPDDPAPYVHIGADYLSQNKYNLALAWLYRATKLDHGAPDTIYLLGNALLKEEYFQSAHEYLAKYVAAKPADPKGWLLMGDAYLNDERTRRCACELPESANACAANGHRPLSRWKCGVPSAAHSGGEEGIARRTQARSFARRSPTPLR